ncbi:MAG: M23 family metallopeptidase [Rhodospirillaceae bacterium]|nr:M23 family metallopeptidase [Rhodospirillales bacterium]
MSASNSSWIKHHHHGRAWLPLVMAGLLGWNLTVPVAWAESQACVHKSQSARLRCMAQSTRAIENALAGTGLRVDMLIRRGGEGGPFVAAGPPVHRDVQRWNRLNRALKVLPLAAPLDNYAVSSGFGLRRDPINRRRAMHAGIDLLAPMRSPVVATAPGRVVFAGRKGGYGRMVEIDHGLGVHTRYGHLSAIHVHTGQSLAVGQRVGLLGSTGRSTGPHLHYEVMVDGKPRNPQPFLKAGIRLNGPG